jgi:predicted RNA-binding protein YlxR (DUF448 family)
MNKQQPHQIRKKRAEAYMALKNRKPPLRMCSGCGERKLKKELIRVVRSPEGEISLDATGKKSGRGAYICPDPECLRKARKARRLERSFSCQIPDEVYLSLEGELIKNE